MKSCDMREPEAYLAAWLCVRIVRDSAFWAREAKGSKEAVYFDGKIAAYLEVLHEMNPEIAERMRRAIAADNEAQRIVTMRHAAGVPPSVSR